MITYDTDFRIHFTNRSLLKMLHLPKDEAARPYEGLPAGSIFKIYNNGKEILRPMLKQVVTEESSVVIPENSFMQEVHSGSYFPVSGEVVPIRAHGKITGMALSARNISDEEMQKRFFDMAVDESAIYPWQFDMETNCFIFPQGFLKRLGYDESVTTISRDEMDRTIHPDDLKEISPLFNRALTGEDSNTRLNFRQRNVNGEYEWWEYRSSVITGLTQDSLYNILGVCQSIQRYKTAEQEMREARDKALQADKLKSAFLANMSHEIRTPLNAIVGFSDVIGSTYDELSEEERADFVRLISINSEHLVRLIDDVLDLSKIESNTIKFTFTDCSLRSLMIDVEKEQTMKPISEIEIRASLPNEDVYINTDATRLKQVISNFINNARKFTEKGYIHFGYAVDSVDASSVHVFVEDTGSGIPKECQKEIFDRFYKVDTFKQGTGLGLSICKTIVEHLQGDIFVESETGKGSRFTVTLPFERQSED